jgi:glycosyltransferase involved in cell wall biosynthesis
MFTNSTSLIIPTRNRPELLNNLLKNFLNSSIKFFEIIVVDSSDNETKYQVENICRKFSAYYFHTLPSTSHQRNFGMKKKSINTKYIMFLDDDVIFFKDSIHEMNKLIFKNINHDEIAAFGFNQIQSQNINFLEKLKISKLAKIFFLYDKKPGSVMPSGWHTKILNLEEDIFADWIFTTACIYKSKSIIPFKFDETLGQYAYLEDLDFSLNLKSINKKIIISSKAKFTHPINIDRSSFNFGVVEVCNRYKIVRKHKLSIIYFALGSVVRFLISFSGILRFNKKLLLRSLGNIYALIKCLKRC